MKTAMLLAGLTLALLFISGTSLAQRKREDPKAKENAELALKVHDMLKAQCWSCHGEPGKRVFGQRGGLNYILDHEKLVDRLVNKDKPEESALYREINDGSMPKVLEGGRARDGKKLPQADIDNVLKWIKAGAPAWPDPNAPADSHTWSELKGEGPRPRTDFAMCEGPRGSIVLFGGYVTEQSKSVFNGETWTFSAGKWQQAAPKANPSPAAGGAMAFDKSRNVAVMFGGLYGDASHEGLTWEWNGTNWSENKTAEAPSPRVRHAMAFDPVRKAVLLFGGAEKGKSVGDLWQYDGKTWQKIEISGAPGPREDAVMAWDAANKAMLLYGGTTAGDKTGMNETWSFDGKAWKKLAPAASPAVTADCAMAAGSDGIFLAGGMGGGTSASECWRWDGKNWARLQSGFGARHGAGLAAEGKGERLILFGGVKVDNPAGDTWALAKK